MHAPLDADRLRELNALLEHALALPSGERTAWLAALQAQQHPLLPALRRLLERAAAQTDTFMQHPAAAAVGPLLDEPLDAAGDVIGPFRLLEELGAGGMSTVWLAERADAGLQRLVALKLPRAGSALGLGLAQRMARERDILGALEHPRIARLYDAGLTPEGRPWLAMERVEGLPIDTFCREHALDIAQRLKLFLQVADAVAHAHARLVVHRDLKPSNILVTHDGEVRLLDFGIAKLLEDETAAGQHLTRQLGRPVTPDYAAPEQVGARPVGTAADVYSLGIVLYEMLTGQRPYRVERHGAAALEDAILHAVVAPMSTRAPDRRIARALRGDLDTIVGKALRKRAQDRYSSVEAFAADVQRHLDGLPVLAQPPSRSYRVGKFVRRNRFILSAAGAVAASLLLGLGLALWQAGVAREQAARAERTTQFIASILKQAQPRQGSGGAVLASDLLALAGERIERELAGDTRAAAELGVTIGEGLSMLGDPERGERTVRAAVARAEQAFGSRHRVTLHARALLAESLRVQHPEEAARVADALVPDALAGLPATADLAVMALRQQSFQRAKANQAEASYASLLQAIDLAEKHLGPRHEDTVLCIGLLSNTYGRFGQYPRQLATAQDALARANAQWAAQRPNLTLTAVERWHAEALRRNDRPADAVPPLRNVLRDQRQLDGADTARVRVAMFQLGLALAEAGQLGEALALLRDASMLEARQNSVDNEDRRALRNATAVVLGFAHRAEEALALIESAGEADAAAPARRSGQAPPPLPQEPTLGQMIDHLRHARLLALTGHARAAAETAANAAQRTDDEHAAMRAEAWHVAAMNARLQRRTSEAIELGQRAWNERGREKARPVAQAAMAAELATAWLDKGDIARAEPLVRQALALFETAQVAPSPRSASAWIAHARLLLKDGRAGRAAEAQRALEPLIASWQSAHPGSAWHGQALWWSSRALAQMGRADAARAQHEAARNMLAGSALPALRQLAMERASP